MSPWRSFLLAGTFLFSSQGVAQDNPRCNLFQYSSVKQTFESMPWDHKEKVLVKNFPKEISFESKLLGAVTIKDVEEDIRRVIARISLAPNGKEQEIKVVFMPEGNYFTPVGNQASIEVDGKMATVKMRIELFAIEDNNMIARIVVKKQDGTSRHEDFKFDGSAFHYALLQNLKEGL